LENSSRHVGRVFQDLGGRVICGDTSGSDPFIFFYFQKKATLHKSYSAQKHL